jgi:hypothetical protein
MQTWTTVGLPLAHSRLIAGPARRAQVSHQRHVAAAPWSTRHPRSGSRIAERRVHRGHEVRVRDAEQRVDTLDLEETDDA